MKILFMSLGCDKNLVDSEMMLGQLSERGYSFTDDEAQADIVVVNTCCFIKDAKEESIETILEMAQLRKNGDIKALIVTGCLAQRYQEEIQKEIPEVDEILGISDIDRIVQAIDEILKNEKKNHISDCNSAPVYGKKRIVTTGGHYAYMKIAEGCDKHCTYCIIPKVRGNFRSIPMESLLQEARTLAEGGVRELILVAQETTLYGVDLYGKKTLPTLLEKLCEIEDLKWIRLLYCYPEEITDELIDTIKKQPKLCHYLDIPIQHASDSILKRMGRRTSEEDLRNIVEKLRREIPDICLRTTLITGFPGESQEDHEILYRFVNELEFDRLGVFTYSPEENTPAASMPDQIEEDIKEQRRDELMELQQAIAFEKAEKMVGKRLEAVVEGYLPEDDVYVARSYMDAPGVDGYIFVYADRQLLSGDYIDVEVIDSREYDLIGKEV
ncbi:MAG: 30S ribosomal protein S12 methylthiotransferase RimO [Lachnospiraceae bacterium]